MAANATFALKPGVWFLRVRFVIFAPDSRREPSPPSGRKSTQPTVQILEASSQTVWPPRLYASIHPIYTGSAAIQPPKGVGFPDPLSGTLKRRRRLIRVKIRR